LAASATWVQQNALILEPLQNAEACLPLRW